MFEKGELVIYETAGVCKVTDIRTVDMRGIDKNKLFYFLEPVGTQGSRFFVPVESHKALLRKMVSREEAGKLLEDAKSLGLLPLPDDKHREESYKAALKSCDCKEWMKMIRTLYRKNGELKARGKKLPAMDSHYLKMAKGCLVTEISLALGMDESEVEEEIAVTVRQAE